MRSEHAPGRPAIDMSLYTIRHRQIGGTEFAIYNWTKGLAQAGARVSVSYGRDADLSPEFLGWLGDHPEVRARRLNGWGGPKNLRFLQETLLGWRPTRDDWLVFPNYFLPPAPRFGRRRAVILHDIQYRIFSQYHSSKRRAWLDAYLPRMFRMADRVLLISQSEARLVREQFGDATAARCSVVPNAVDWSRMELPGEPLPPAVQARLGRRYVLSVCHPFPHKNVATLLRAFAGLAKDDPETRLYLVGSESAANTALLRSAIPESLADRVEFLGFVDDRTLGAYYRHARLFALPSLYEGFGIPAVEAMGFGTPTLVSRCFALPESTLELAQYVDGPEDVEEWRRRMAAALAGPERLPPATVDRVRAFYAPERIGRIMLEALDA